MNSAKINWKEIETKYSIRPHFNNNNKNKSLSYEHMEIDQYKTKMCSFKTSADKMKFWIKAIEDYFWEEIGSKTDYSLIWKELKDQKGDIEQIVITISKSGTPGNTNTSTKGEEKLMLIKILLTTGTIMCQGNKFHHFRDECFPALKTLVDKFSKEETNYEQEKEIESAIDDIFEINTGTDSSILEEPKLNLDTPIKSSVDELNPDIESNSSEYESDTDLLDRNTNIKRNTCTSTKKIVYSSPQSEHKRQSPKFASSKKRSKSDMKTLISEMKKLRKEFSEDRDRNIKSSEIIQNSLQRVEQKQVNTIILVNENKEDLEKVKKELDLVKQQLNQSKLDCKSVQNQLEQLTRWKEETDIIVMISKQIELSFNTETRSENQRSEN